MCNFSPTVVSGKRITIVYSYTYFHIKKLRARENHKSQTIMQKFQEMAKASSYMGFKNNNSQRILPLQKHTLPENLTIHQSVVRMRGFAWFQPGTGDGRRMVVACRWSDPVARARKKNAISWTGGRNDDNTQIKVVRTTAVECGPLSFASAVEEEWTL